MREIDLTGQSFEDEEPWRWSKPALGVPPLTPDQYFHLGRCAAVLPLALDLANGESQDWLADLNPTAAERAAVDQALAGDDRRGAGCRRVVG